MTIANTIIAALKKRLAATFAAVALAAVASNGALAMTAQDRAGCEAPGCEIVAAAQVADDQRGSLAITDSKGRVWQLVSFEGKAPVEIGTPIDWNDGYAVIAAHDRYAAALHRGEGLGLRVSTDGRYHVCVRDGAVTCLYVPAG